MEALLLLMLGVVGLLVPLLVLRGNFTSLFGRSNKGSHTAEAPKPPAERIDSEPDRQPLMAPLLAAAALMLPFASFPSRPLTTGVESWSHVVLYARDHGLRFGHDLIYTCGPAGFLFMPYFAEHTPAFRLIADVIFSYLLAAGFCLVAWQMRVTWRIAFFAAFLIGPTIWLLPGMPELPFIIGLFCWVLVASRYRWAVWVLAPLAATFGLAKLSSLVTGGISIAAIAWQRRSILPIAAYFLSLIGIWLAVGGRLMEVWSFAREALQILSGYDAVMVIEPKALAVILGLLAAASALAVVWRSPVHSVIKVWLGALMFSICKYSFAKAGVYQNLFGFAPLCALALGGMTAAANTDAVHRIPPRNHEEQNRSRTRWNASLLTDLGLVGFCCAISVVALAIFERGWLGTQAELVLNRALENGHLLVSPGDYVRATKQAVAVEKQRAQLPAIRQIVGASTVDVFDWDAAYATFNDLNYTPRPCCQSYTAFTPQLLRLNAEFYRTNAPQFVLFQLNALYGHFPPAEDGLVLQHIALNYEPIAKEGDFVLLKRASSEAGALRLIEAGSLQADEFKDIPPSEERLWLEITSKRHPLRRFVCSEPLLAVTVRVDQQEYRYEGPRPLLASGFLLNPLLLTTGDIYQIKGTAVPTRKIAFSFSEKVQYRLYRIVR